jgi:hypothetical protein
VGKGVGTVVGVWVSFASGCNDVGDNVCENDGAIVGEDIVGAELALLSVGDGVVGETVGDDDGADVAAVSVVGARLSIVLVGSFVGSFVGRFVG